ncbi:MAG: preprotein translocase subunit SecE [Muribaculaceae bacterium]
MKKLKLLTNIEESFEELRYKTSWPTKNQVVKSALLVLIASIIIAAIVTYLMDMVANFVMTTLYNV